MWATALARSRRSRGRPSRSAPRQRTTGGSTSSAAIGTPSPRASATVVPLRSPNPARAGGQPGPARVLGLGNGQPLALARPLRAEEPADVLEGGVVLGVDHLELQRAPRWAPRVFWRFGSAVRQPSPPGRGQQSVETSRDR